MLKHDILKKVSENRRRVILYGFLCLVLIFFFYFLIQYMTDEGIVEPLRLPRTSTPAPLTSDLIETTLTFEYRQ